MWYKHSTAILSLSFLFHLTAAIQNLIYLIMGLDIILPSNVHRVSALAHMSKRGAKKSAPKLTRGLLIVPALSYSADNPTSSCF
ncbi:hypothetical protein V8C40DRAFT_228907 [Trichoderma camerunense]